MWSGCREGNFIWHYFAAICCLCRARTLATWGWAGLCQVKKFLNLHPNVKCTCPFISLMTSSDERFHVYCLSLRRGQRKSRVHSLSLRFRNTTINGNINLTVMQCSSLWRRGGSSLQFREINPKDQKQLHFSCLLPFSPWKLTLDLPLIMTSDKDITSLLVLNIV